MLGNDLVDCRDGLIQLSGETRNSGLSQARLDVRRVAGKRSRERGRSGIQLARAQLGLPDDHSQCRLGLWIIELALSELRHHFLGLTVVEHRLRNHRNNASPADTRTPPPCGTPFPRWPAHR